MEKKRKRKKLKKPVLTIRRRDRIWCDCNSRHNCHESKLMVLERQSCSPWKRTNWRSLISFFHSSISHNWKTRGRAQQRPPPCYASQRLVAEKSQGRFFSEALLTELTAVRNASRQLLAVACTQPSCRGFLPLLPFNVWAGNSSCPAPQPLQNHICCCVLHMARVGQRPDPSLHSRSGLLTQFLWKLPPLAYV